MNTGVKIFVVAVILILAVIVLTDNDRLGGLGDEINPSLQGTEAEVVVNGTTTAVFALKTDARFRSITNTGTSTAYLLFDSQSTYATSTSLGPGEGYALSSSTQTLELYGSKLYGGKIWATTESGESTTLSTLEL